MYVYYKLIIIIGSIIKQRKYVNEIKNKINRLLNVYLLFLMKERNNKIIFILK